MYVTSSPHVKDHNKVVSDTYELQHQELPSGPERVAHVTRNRKCLGLFGSKQIFIISEAIRSFSSTDRVCVPHPLLGVHVGTFLDQSLNIFRVPIHGSPYQGSPALLRDKRVRQRAAALR